MASYQTSAIKLTYQKAPTKTLTDPLSPIIAILPLVRPIPSHANLHKIPAQTFHPLHCTVLNPPIPAPIKNPALHQLPHIIPQHPHNPINPKPALNPPPSPHLQIAPPPITAPPTTAPQHPLPYIAHPLVPIW
jgi:hypothetical protein